MFSKPLTLYEVGGFLLDICRVGSTGTAPVLKTGILNGYLGSNPRLCVSPDMLVNCPAINRFFRG